MDANTADMKNKRMVNLVEKERKKSVVREWIEAIVVAFILAMIIRTFVVQAFKIPSGSMKQTLQIGDHILVNKFIYRFTDVEREDIIVFIYPKDESRDFIKRVIGLPGEKLEIRNQTVYINDQPLTNKPYVYHEKQDVEYYYPRDNYGPIIIPAGKVFVMGDNRENSADSRFWGLLDQEKIKGKAFIIYWSWDNDNFRVRWDRLGSILR